MDALDRRRFLLLLAAGTIGTIGSAEVLAGWTRSTAEAIAEPASKRPPSPRPGIPPPHPGRPVVLDRLPRTSSRIALTVDDGYDKDVVAAYVRFAADSGVHLTFSPNGAYRRQWEPHAPVLRPLITAGQVQIMNHTYHHPDLTKLASAAVRSEIDSNEQWIQRTFGTTSRPWFRPPYGYRDARTDDLAGELGFTRILMWNGDLGDAFPISSRALLSNARRYLTAGTVVIGHANHPTITKLYDELVTLIRQRNLRPATLDEAFGTSRATG